MGTFTTVMKIDITRLFYNFLPLEEKFQWHPHIWKNLQLREWQITFFLLQSADNTGILVNDELFYVFLLTKSPLFALFGIKESTDRSFYQVVTFIQSWSVLCNEKIIIWGTFTQLPPLVDMILVTARKMQIDYLLFDKIYFITWHSFRQHFHRRI